MKRFVLMSLLLGLSLAGCGGGTSNEATPTADPSRPTATAEAAQPTLAAPAAPTPAPLPTATPSTQTNTGQPSNARQIIGDAANKWNTSGPYKMTVISTIGGSAPMEMWVVPSDRSRYTQKQSDGSVIEGINIGSTSYSLIDGVWTTSNTGGVKVDEPIWTDPAALNDIENIQSLGSKTMNGVQAEGFTFTDKSAPGEMNTMWIGPNGAPMQVISATTDETVTMDIVYDASITVDAPVK
jgi:hypothetical protein